MIDVGWAQRRLHVPPGTELGGYLGRTGTAQGTHDPLTVAVLTFHDGRRRAALAVADVVCVNVDLVAAARSAMREYDVGLLWLAATHTHAGPEVGCLPGGRSTPSPWRKRLTEVVRDLVAKAMMVERPVTVRRHRAVLDGIAGRRTLAPNVLALPLDLISFGPTDSRRPHAILGTFPCHPTILGPDNLMVSSDLVGAVRRSLKEGCDGDDPVVALANGAAGDIGPRHQRHARSFDEIDRIGQTIGLAGARALATGQPIWSEESFLRWSSKSLVLEPRPLEEVPRSEAPEYTLLREAGWLVRGGDQVLVEVSVLRAGWLTMVAVPGELFFDLGEAIISAVSPPALLIGYANGYPGYLPDREAYRSDQRYEVMVSPVDAGSGERVMRAARRLMASVRS